MNYIHTLCVYENSKVSDIIININNDKPKTCLCNIFIFVEVKNLDWEKNIENLLFVKLKMP